MTSATPFPRRLDAATANGGRGRAPSAPRAERPASRQGFTLVELMIVLVVIAALMALGFPAVMALRERQREQRTAATLQTVLSAALAYRLTSISVPRGGGPQLVRQLWDFNGDGFLDGDPELDPGFGDAERRDAAAVGYRGSRDLPMEPLAGRSRDEAGRLLDGWGRPLRIAFGASVYGAARVGLWSTGQDGVPLTSDDVRSWRSDAVR